MSSSPVPSAESLTLPSIGVRVVPVLPLPNGVVLPGQVVTIALESPEAIVAVEGAMAHERRVLLVPRPEGRYSSVGVVGRIEKDRKSVV